jgi:kynurenine formamidase
VVESFTPAYRTLPVSQHAPPGSSWGVWADARLGCLNRLSPERIVAARESIRSGRCFGLSLELDLPNPPLFGRRPLQHEVVTRPNGHMDDVYHDWNTQSSTQWDGFRHVPHPVHGYYGGLQAEEHGVDVWAERGIVGRGMLVDVDRWRRSIGRPLEHGTADPITAHDLTACLKAQRSHLRAGDILLLRTGWVTWYRRLDAMGRTEHSETLAAPGLSGDDIPELLWDMQIAAVCADNPAVEMSPLPTEHLHRQLIPLLGVPLGEMWDLDALAHDCATDRSYDCFVCSAPNRMPHGVASPANAIAIR